MTEEEALVVGELRRLVIDAWVAIRQANNEIKDMQNELIAVKTELRNIWSAMTPINFAIAKNTNAISKLKRGPSAKDRPIHTICRRGDDAIPEF